MASPLTLSLSEPAREELVALRDHAPRAYLRERAAALLKIAQGTSAHQVARSGLLKPRDPDTVYSWVQRYRAWGVEGLKMTAGRGRKAKFSPSERVTGTAGTAGDGAS